MALIGDFLKALAQMTDRRFLRVLILSLALTIGLLVLFADPVQPARNQA